MRLGWLILFILRFFRQNRWWKAILLGWLVTYIASLIAAWRVVPMPLSFLFVFSLISTGFLLIPYILDKWLNSKVKHWSSVFVFPAAMTIMDFIAAQGGGGTWGNVAYAQFSNIYLMQLAAVTGIWGISFMLYWLASSANYIYENWQEGKSIQWPIRVYTLSFLLVMGFGFLRLKMADNSATKSVKVAAITVENLSIIEKMYEGETGKSIQIPPTAFQADAEMAEAFATLASFVETPFDPKFQAVFEETDRVLNQLWAKSEEAVRKGAKIISWTEAIVNTIKSEEEQYIQQAKAFAQKHQVWLFFPMAAIIPGKIVPNEPFIENKVLTINPKGEIVNTYFKNIPVGGVEPCFAGDGSIPVIPTEYGKLSPVICYDADFPQLLQQVGQQATEMLIVPSGDWKDIAHIHAYMAVTRAIENGVAILRPVSKGLTVAADSYGRIIAQDYYFEDDDHLLLAEVPIQKVPTLYTFIGDAFVYICGLGLFFLMLLGISKSTVLFHKDPITLQKMWRDEWQKPKG